MAKKKERNEIDAECCSRPAKLWTRFDSDPDPGKKDQWPVGSKALPMLEKFVEEWCWWLVENQQKTPAGEAGKIGGTHVA